MRYKGWIILIGIILGFLCFMPVYTLDDEEFDTSTGYLTIQADTVLHEKILFGLVELRSVKVKKGDWLRPRWTGYMTIEHEKE